MLSGKTSVAILVVGSVALMSSPSCKHTPAQEDASDVSFSQGFGGASHGHEKLTELATKLANEALDPKLADRPRGFAKVLPWNWGAGPGREFFPEDQIAQPAYRNSHPMIWGSLSADFPPVARRIKVSAQIANEARDTSRDVLTHLNLLLCKHYGMAGQSGSIEPDLRPYLAKCDGMPVSGSFQDVHFLRNWTGDMDLETGREACMGAQERVRNATIAALTKWPSRFHDPDQGVDAERYPHFMGLYFVGLALHTIQDSFSGAHVDRDPQAPRNIRKICHYNGAAIEKNYRPDICRHKVPFDPRDLIWKHEAVGHLTTTKYVTGAVTTLLNRLGGEFDDLTAEGQGAVTASAAYLVTFARILSELPQAMDGGLLFDESPANLAVVDRELNVFFNYTGSDDAELRLQGSGFMNCKNVREQI